MPIHQDANDSDSSSPHRRPMRQPEREIRMLAARAGYATLGAAAREAGVHRKTLVGAARGAKEPTADTVHRIAVILHVDADVVTRLFALARAERER